MNKAARSSCKGKVRHASPTTGRIALRRTIKQTGDRMLEMYHCQHCGGYHVGHARLSEQKRRKYSDTLKAIDRAMSASRGSKKS